LLLDKMPDNMSDCLQVKYSPKSNQGAVKKEGRQAINGSDNSLNVNWNTENGLNVENWRRGNSDSGFGVLAR